jgi:hypothetical protein
MSSVMLCDGMRRRTRTFNFSLGLRPGLLISLLFIAAISAIDIWFAVANSSILHVEKNPICEFLLRLDPESCVFFVLGKSFGTATVLLTLASLHIYGYRHAKLVTIVITCFQVCLFVFLTLSDPQINHLPNFGLLFSETPESIWVID